MGRSLTGSETRFLKRFNPADLDVVVVVASVTTATFSAATTGSTTSTASPSVSLLVDSVSDTVSLVLDSSTWATTAGAVSVVVVEVKRPRFSTDDMGRGETILLVGWPVGLDGLLTAGSETLGSVDPDAEDSAGLLTSV